MAALGALPAFGYLVLMVAVGDTISRPFFTYVSRAHRLATAFLVGLIVCTWLTYMLSFAFRAAVQPLAPGDAVAAGVMGIVAVGGLTAAWRRRQRPVEARPDGGQIRSEIFDWIVIGGISAFVTWMMVSTFNYSDGQLRIANDLWSDFGPTTAISQSFVFGHNFPTEYPHFANAPILYHFMYYFQVGNLTYLGLDPALANNVLSIASMVAMLVLVMALGQRLFRSTAVGRLGAILFFFLGSLSFVRYLGSFSSPSQAAAGISGLDHFIASGFPYRGEEWGIWTQIVYLNQRHLASAIGILLIALLFVLDRLETAPTDDSEVLRVFRERLGLVLGRGEVADEAVEGVEDEARPRPWSGIHDPALPGYVLCGLLLGLLPLWNSAIFVASAAVFGAMFLLFPRRIQMLGLAVGAAVPAIPQVLALRPPGIPGTTAYPSFHWGYIVDDPTIQHVAAYAAFTFGPKLILIALALVLGTWFQRRLFLAISTLLAVAFLVQLSVEVLANHKFINTWLVVANLFVAYALWRLWQARGLVQQFLGRAVAIVLVGLIVGGGLIDVFTIKNERMIGVRVAGDQLLDWVRQNTKPTDVFLTDLYVVSPILLAGRRIYYGWPYYAWSAGYDVGTRERLYREMLQDRSPRDVIQLLQENRVAYVVFDDGLRHRGFVQQLNEEVYRSNFQEAFVDTTDRYGNLIIYRVPTAPDAAQSVPGAPAGDMFTGGKGTAPAQFDGPRGIAVEQDGSILVADTQNDRIQRFSPDGTYLSSFGTKGSGPGQFDEPNGVAVDSRGHILVADTANQRVQEFDEQDRFVREWRGPAPGFYGPRDLAFADDVLYVLDQGRGRVVRQAPDGSVSTFGSLGSGDGQLKDPTGIAVGGGDVFVADARNGRIEVFDTSGRFVKTWPVPEWQKTPYQYPDVVYGDGNRLFASSTATDEVLVLTPDGTRLGSLKPTPPDRLEGAGAMAAKVGGGLYVVEFYGDRVALLTQTNP